MLRISHHRLRSIWCRSIVVAVLAFCGFSVAGAPLEKLRIEARDVSATPGAAELARRFADLPEDDSPMRFRVAESAPLAHWQNLDLSTGSRPLETAASEGATEITLPNSGKSFLRVVREKTGAFYELRFSSPEVGIPKTVPAKAGNVLLLVAPQNKAHDTVFLLIILHHSAASGI